MFNKKFTVLVVMVLMLSVTAFAGDTSKELQKFAKIVTPEFEAQNDAIRQVEVSRINQDVAPSQRDAGIVWSASLGTTIYDYPTNNVSGRYLATTASNNVHAVFMKRLSADVDRLATYNYADNGYQFMFGEQSIDEGLGFTGWVKVVNGQNNEAITVNHGGGIWAYGDAGEAAYAFANLGAGNVDDGTNVFPGHYMDADGGLHVTYNAANYVYSSDGGATWSAPTWPTNAVVDTFIVGNIETWPVGYDGTVGFMGTVEDPGGAYGGGLAWYTTADNGASWESTVLFEETDWFADDEGGMQSYLIQNFSQLNNMWSDDGNVHLVFNGYGLDALDGDTTAIFPIMYWNTNDGALVELTDAAFSAHDQALSDAILAGYPGNGIGNAYPTITAGNGGEDLMVFWQQIEMADGLPVTANDVYGNPSAFYATDIYAAYSNDAGSTWSDPVFIGGREGLTDVYPITTRNAWVGDDGYVHTSFVWFEDADAGVSLFGEGTDALGEWFYGEYAFPDTDINDGEAAIAKEFSLKQNYPNPFNPSTTIAFELAKAGQVTLEVFNVTGQKVATLVDGRMAAGEQEVDFNAVNFASGVYFYSLTAGDYVQTRKMVLMK